MAASPKILPWIPLNDGLLSKQQLALESTVSTLRKLEGRDKFTKVIAVFPAHFITSRTPRCLLSELNCYVALAILNNDFLLVAENSLSLENNAFAARGSASSVPDRFQRSVCCGLPSAVSIDHSFRPVDLRSPYRWQHLAIAVRSASPVLVVPEQESGPFESSL